MKKTLCVVAMAALAAATWFYGYRVGQNHKPKPTNSEMLQTAFDAGRSWSQGWHEAEQSWGIHWVKGVGWMSDRCVTTNAPHADRERDFYNVNTSRPDGTNVTYKP